MSTTLKKPTKAKASSKSKSTSAAPKSAEAAMKSAKSSEALLKGASAKNEAASKAPIKAGSASTPAAKVAKPTLVGKPQPVVLGPVMRKKELIDTVVTRTGIKKKDAKPVVEGMLAVLGEALAEGRELVLPPLGKVLVRKEKQMPNGKVMVVKVRQSNPPVAATPKPFSDAAE